MSESYAEFCAGKRPAVVDCGFDCDELPEFLMQFQTANVRTALKRGRSAMFAECGLGKTPMQLVWAHEIAKRTGGKLLILAPLAVSQQTIREGEKFSLPVAYARNQSEVTGPVTITNYERLDGFDTKSFTGVVLDESSILKAYAGKTKRQIIEAFEGTQFKLACSATPAPNDYMELGNHSEFLGVMASNEMLARWFIVDTQLQAGNYRLKGHAKRDFWDWVSSWATMTSKPSDIDPSFDDSKFKLPGLEVIKHCVDVDQSFDRKDGMLLRLPELNATSIHKERRISLSSRVEKAKELIEAEIDEPWLVWADTDYEADALAEAIPSLRNVKGSMSLESKESALIGFSSGDPLHLLTKPKMAGFGMNWQHCARMLFVSATFSFESWYQAIRREYRFGQTRPVHAHMIFGATEVEVMAILDRKRNEFSVMQREMFEAARRRQHKIASDGAYRPSQLMATPPWLVSEYLV